MGNLTLRLFAFTSLLFTVACGTEAPDEPSAEAQSAALVEVDARTIDALEPGAQFVADLRDGATYVFDDRAQDLDFERVLLVTDDGEATLAEIVAGQGDDLVGTRFSLGGGEAAGPEAVAEDVTGDGLAVRTDALVGGCAWVCFGSVRICALVCIYAY